MESASGGLVSKRLCGVGYTQVEGQKGLAGADDEAMARCLTKGHGDMAGDGEHGELDAPVEAVRRTIDVAGVEATSEALGTVDRGAGLVESDLVKEIPLEDGRDLAAVGEASEGNAVHLDTKLFGRGAAYKESGAAGCVPGDPGEAVEGPQGVVEGASTELQVPASESGFGMETREPQLGSESLRR